MTAMRNATGSSAMKDGDVACVGDGTRVVTMLVTVRLAPDLDRGTLHGSVQPRRGGYQGAEAMTQEQLLRSLSRLLAGRRQARWAKRATTRRGGSLRIVEVRSPTGRLSSCRQKAPRLDRSWTGQTNAMPNLCITEAGARLANGSRTWSLLRHGGAGWQCGGHDGKRREWI